MIYRCVFTEQNYLQEESKSCLQIKNTLFKKMHFHYIKINKNVLTFAK